MGEMLRSRIVRTIVLVVLLLAGASLLPRAARTEGPTKDDFERACEEGDPFLVTANLRGIAREQSTKPYDLDAPSVVLFSDTANDRPQYSLASIEDVGAVWGLAYRGTQLPSRCGARSSRRMCTALVRTDRR